MIGRELPLQSERRSGGSVKLHTGIQCQPAMAQRATRPPDRSDRTESFATINGNAVAQPRVFVARAAVCHPSGTGDGIACAHLPAAFFHILDKSIRQDSLFSFPLGDSSAILLKIALQKQKNGATREKHS